MEIKICFQLVWMNYKGKDAISTISNNGRSKIQKDTNWYQEIYLLSSFIIVHVALMRLTRMPYGRNLRKRLTSIKIIPCLIIAITDAARLLNLLYPYYTNRHLINNQSMQFYHYINSNYFIFCIYKIQLLSFDFNDYRINCLIIALENR